jgi:molecular chaperone DnaJ
MAAQSRDYYEVLGVTREASAEDLKRAYRNMARKFHPDVNRAPEATDRFKEIQEAYDVLSDDSRRRQYDRYGHAGLNGNGGFSEGFGAGGPFGDIFDIFFGAQNAARTGSTVLRGDDLRLDLELTLEDAVLGVEKTVQIQRLEACEVCRGSGARPGTQAETCGECRGAGEVRFSRPTLLGTFTSTQTCPRCRGTGKTIASPCEACRGAGRTRKLRDRNVKVPPGADTGMRLRLPGEGDAGDRGGPAGDLYLVIHVKEHELFERRGNDLYCEAPMSFARAALGGTIQVPVINGVEDLKIPEGTQPGQVFTLRGKGVPDINGRGRGDQHVIVKVEVPTRLTAEQRELLRQFAASFDDPAGDGADNKGLFERIFGHQT